ncbi:MULTISPECIES: DUF2835 family protein [Corallincola]|uniref:DUF2835 family protein n=2 Tax=Corallincola TaxID=1775176 RepID=A0A368NT49_9GAMM|nr:MULTISPECIES: DUF2835 family protein [Corallincola]RCU52659.1 DUF2835 family protein [Corallincola holothuriorum]TAA48160.1 DUF2835 family protein [Corallincola spongiicola]
MAVYYFNVRLSFHEFQALYKGQASTVLVSDQYGRRIQLPATRFRPFLSQRGIEGRFELQTDSENRFVSLKKT